MQEFVDQIIYQNYHSVGALAPTFVEILLSFLTPLLAVFGRLESPFGRGLIRRIAESFIISTRPCRCPCQVVLSVRVFVPFFFLRFFDSFFSPLIRRPSAQAGRSGSIGTLARPVPSQVGNVSVSYHSGSCLLVT